MRHATLARVIKSSAAADKQQVNKPKEALKSKHNSNNNNKRWNLLEVRGGRQQETLSRSSKTHQQITLISQVLRQRPLPPLLLQAVEEWGCLLEFLGPKPTATAMSATLVVTTATATVIKCSEAQQTQRSRKAKAARRVSDREREERK